VTDVLLDSYLAALGAMKAGGPKALFRRAAFEADERGTGTDVTVDRLIERLRTVDLNDQLRKQLHLTLATWDAAPIGDAVWTAGTEPRTLHRRTAIYQLLDVDTSAATAFDELFPVKSDDTIVISDEFEPWYTPDRRAEHQFYWPAYSQYLLDARDWDADSIADLDDATTQVVERLGDPYRPEAYQSKGLVVGYVQSGKTANFTGVLAKAVDAGYRLLIVMTGTVDLLRAQTQRRIDMELVGVENILRGVDPGDEDLLTGVDYQDDPDWANGRFVRHGFLPSSNGLPDIIRLTTHRFDYKSLQAGITALEFEKEQRSKPLFDPVNLPRSSARLVIVKKNKAVLDKLVKDLRSITARLGEIPALIIDDESDQASVNTTDPKKWASDRPERTAINRLISQLLGLLPRSQYVGYTATPFANVFIDPGDVEDIFPRDYLVSLDRPPGYMGVGDFHDIDSEVDPPDRNVANSQEKAHVRDLVAEGDARAGELLEAVDAFVLSGALKLYREAHGLGNGYFRHHTMLVHESVKQLEHRALADDIRNLWGTAGYSSPTGVARLRLLYENDFVRVCRARATEQFPDDFAELKPLIGSTVARITAGGNPVIVVNGDKDLAQEAIDFDKRSVWRVLVGGTKLSRGFTVEGLTVSYYRRKTKQADTLMQMGRWFGFRRGYRDLVRLYIGRAEPDGSRTLDLYQAFEAIVRDEERFREQLRQYATLVEGKPQITPAQIPPLVSQHLPWLKPAARNKMFNSKLVVRRSPGTPVEPTGLPQSRADLRQNFEAALPLMVSATTAASLIVPPTDKTKATRFDAFIGLVAQDVVLGSLRQFRWITDEYFSPDLAFFEELSGQVDDWAIVLPQLGVRGTYRVLPRVGRRSLFRRDRQRGPLFQAISDPKHRHAVLRVANSRDAYGDAIVEQLRKDRRGAALVYPIIESDMEPTRSDEVIDPSNVVIAITLVAPTDAAISAGHLVQFVARNSADKKAAIVDVSDGD
jgi:hypothetical protein